MGYTREEIEEMDPLVTFIEVQKKIAEKQNELLGEIDLVSLQSKLGSGSSKSGSSGDSEAGDAAQEVVEEVTIYFYFISSKIFSKLKKFLSNLNYFFLFYYFYKFFCELEF